jgi:outer membrane lipoprotein-sorting protein
VTPTTSHNNRRRTVIAALLAAATLTPVGAARAEKPKAQGAAAAKPAAAAKKVSLPKKTGEQIFADFLAASGGQAAYDRVKSTVMVGKMTMAAQGLNGDLRMEFKAPGKFHAVQEIGGFGKAEQGFDGKVAWSKDPLNGLRVLSGAELEQAKQQGRQNQAFNWRDLYSKVEALEPRLVNGAPAYVVRATPKSGKAPQTMYFDAKSRLLVRTDQVIDSPNGKIPTESYLSDYRTVDGLKTPFKLRQVVGGGVAEVVMTFTSVKNNVPVDDAVFAKPEETVAAPAAAPAAKP